MFPYNHPHFVYVLRDGETGPIRYIGCTINLERRIAAHKCEKKLRNPTFREWIISVGDNLVIEAVDRFESKDPALMAERQLIAEAFAAGFSIFNSQRVLAGYGDKTRHKVIDRISPPIPRSTRALATLEAERAP